MSGVPQWFRDAKLGIIVHWGVASVPGWAPVAGGTPVDRLRTGGWSGFFQRCPHASWYANGMRLDRSDVAAYHRSHYGRHVAYERFARRFNEGLDDWDPYDWAELFAEAGARYVVMTAKGPDGFLLWPSDHRPADSFVAGRDIVGELATAVRTTDLKFGIAYSGLLDWTQQERRIAGGDDLIAPVTTEYGDYVDRHLHELIDRYQPDLLWGQYGLPPGPPMRTVREYRRSAEDRIANSGWWQPGSAFPVAPLRALAARSRALRLVGAARMKRAYTGGDPIGSSGDYRTVEYAVPNGISSRPWELVRALGNSFGYNRDEGPDQIVDGRSLIHQFVDVVSRNGNLLLSVGPTPSGRIPVEQRRPLAEFAEWLSIHGEAVFRTRPWIRAEGVTDQGVAVRFTTRENALYAILLDAPRALRITLEQIDIRRIPRPKLARGEEDEFCVRIIGNDREIEWDYRDSRLSVNVPGSYRATAAPVIKIGWRSLAGPRSDFYTDVI